MEDRPIPEWFALGGSCKFRDNGTCCAVAARIEPATTGEVPACTSALVHPRFLAARKPSEPRRDARERSLTLAAVFGSNFDC